MPREDFARQKRDRWKMQSTIGFALEKAPAWGVEFRAHYPSRTRLVPVFLSG